MQYQVFVQHPSEQQFIASIVSIPGVTAEGQTKAEAIAKAKAMLKEKLARNHCKTSSSSRIVIRVFPGEIGSTAPRLP